MTNVVKEKETVGEAGQVNSGALEPLLKVDDLERILRVDRRTIARQCERGLLPRPFKLGKCNRWRAADVAALIERLNNHMGSREEETVVTSEA